MSCVLSASCSTANSLTAELATIRAELALPERADEQNAEAVNDLSENMRHEPDDICQAIAALSVRTPQARYERRPIGFRKGNPK